MCLTVTAAADMHVFWGGWCPAKGVREAALTARLAGVPLRIAAKMREPLETDYFDQAVRPLLGRDVEYLGELSAQEKYHLLGGALAMINPIQWPEPFGLVMIESLACGTPVVATPCGSVPEIVKDGVTGFVRNKLSTLAEALTHAAKLDRRSCRKLPSSPSARPEWSPATWSCTSTCWTKTRSGEQNHYRLCLSLPSRRHDDPLSDRTGSTKASWGASKTVEPETS